MSERLATAVPWPADNVRVDLTGVEQMTNGTARLVSVAIRDAGGRPSRFFRQGDTVHVFFEFDVLADLPIGSAGLSIHDEGTGIVVYGKNEFQFGTARPVPAGSRMRCRHSFVLSVGVGSFACDIGLAASDEEGYRRYRSRELPHASFNSHTWECCRVMGATNFVVSLPADGQLSHHGMADLEDESTVVIERMPTGAPHDGRALGSAPAASQPAEPAILHVTHWKAGSQWLHKILAQAVPDRIVAPQAGQAQVFHWPIKSGGVYPTVYASYQQLRDVPFPPGTRRFVMIRDLRDTLVSAYFSFKHSHPILEAAFGQLKEFLDTLSFDEGMMHLMDTWLFGSAVIQLSWIEAGEPVIRYEDVLERDVEILEETLIDRCSLPIARERLRDIIAANRFEHLTGGRRRGEEDLTAHERKGVAGDWRIHFTDRVTKAFKTRYGGVLIASGYEKDLEW
jgi:hypothetical protein